MAFPLILRLAWRQVRRRWLQSLFLVVGVAIGVAMIVAVDLANGSAQRAFELAAESVTGRATHQIVGGPGGVDEAIYTDLRRQLGYRDSAPVVEDYVSVAELGGQPMRLLGIDPFAENPFRSYLGVQERDGPAPAYLTDLMARPDTVLLSTDVAQRYSVQPGDALTVEVGGQRRPLEIVGLLAPGDELSRRGLEGLLITDLATGQEVLGKVGTLDRIDLIVPPGEPGQATLARIAAILPGNVRIVTSAARTSTVGDMTAAFSLNLTALSLLALVVGMFLIYNTVTFSVVQRRPVLGSLRALGMTRPQVFLLILSEALVLGLIGTILGLGLGVVMGRGAVQLVTQTINDLFFVVSVRELEVQPLTLVKGALVGLGAALIGAAAPALEATAVAPAGALRRSNIEDRARRALPWLAVTAVAVLALAALLLWPETNLVVSFVGLFGIIIGSALLAPPLTQLWMTLVQQVTNRWGGVIARMAPRTLLRSLSRTSVAIAALMVAVSVIIGVGVMIESFRTTVVLWLDDVLQADIFVSPPSLNANQVTHTVDPQVMPQLAALPGIARMATTRGVDVAAYTNGIPTGLTTDEAITVRLVAVSEDIAGANRRYRAAVGDWAATWAAVEQGGIILNEPMANRYKLKVGDRLVFQTDHGYHDFPVAGIAVDFDLRPVAFMADPVYRQWWDDRAISAVGVFVAPGLDVDAKVEEIRAALAGDGDLLVRSNRGTREGALEVFDRTFAITAALQLLATIVAFIGILSTLLSLQLERQREIGVLRANGMTRRQLWRLTFYETGLMGLTAGLLAIPAGLTLAVVLIYIINLRSFGWTLELQLDPRAIVQAFVAALVAALLAGIYPAWKMGQAQPASALRAE